LVEVVALKKSAVTYVFACSPKERDHNCAHHAVEEALQPHVGFLDRLGLGVRRSVGGLLNGPVSKGVLLMILDVVGDETFEFLVVVATVV
jgi:hypothetical protein